MIKQYQQSLWGRIDNPLVPLLVTVVFYSIFVGARLFFNFNDPTYFIGAGDFFCDLNSIPDRLRVMPDTTGYDGQFYYRLALYPFTSKVQDFGIRFDVPAYRQQRILYPLIVWGVSLGKANLVPVLMILINFLGLGIIGWMGGVYSQLIKRHALWGIVFSLYPGFISSLSRNLTEIVAVCLMFASLLLMQRNKNAAVTVLLTLAVLARETTLIAVAIALGVWLIEVWKKEPLQQIKWHTFTIPFVVYCLWQIFLYYRWGIFPILEGRSQGVDFPFLGLFDYFLGKAKFNAKPYLWWSSVYFVIIYTIVVVNAYHSTNVSLYVRLLSLAYMIFIFLLDSAFWINEGGFMRILAEFYIVGSLVILGSRSKMKAPIFICSIILWLVLGIDRAREF